MKKLFLFLIMFFLAGSPSSAFSLVFPYQKCEKKNTEYTQEITSESAVTEADFCIQCQEDPIWSKLWKHIQSTVESLSIPKQCFLAMAIRGNKLFPDKQYISCSQSQLRNFDGYTKLCVNEDYVNMIQQAFADMSYCFNYTWHRQKEIFHLINQESGGILNIQSPTSARCLGQITTDYVKHDVNKYIQSTKRKRPLKYSEIYDEVIQRCPHLEQKVLKNLNSMTCQMIRDPYVCLFYTFFGLEKNHRKISDSLNSVTSYMGNREFSKEDKQKFKLPIKVNEMLNIQVEFNGKKSHWVFWDDSELYDTLKNIRASKKPFKILRTKKTPLFKNQEDIELLFNYWSYNGGNSLASSRLIPMVERLKQNLSQSCKSADSEKPRCIAREQIKKGQSLNSNTVLPFFENDLLANYPSRSKSRRTEVAYYVRKVIQTNKNVFGYKNESQQTNTMINFYRKAFSFKKRNVELDHNTAEEFQKNVSEVCPETDFI